MSRGRYRCTTEVFNCSVGATNGHRSPTAVTLLNTLSSEKQRLNNLFKTEHPENNTLLFRGTYQIITAALELEKDTFFSHLIFLMYFFMNSPDSKFTNHIPLIMHKHIWTFPVLAVTQDV